MRKWQIRHAAIWCNWGWGVVVVCGGVQALYPHLRWISDRWFTKSKSVSPLTATTSSRSPRRLKLWLERTPRPQPDTLATTRAVAECVPRLVQCNLPENAGKKRNGKLAGASCAANRPDATSGWRGWWPNQWIWFWLSQLLYGLWQQHPVTVRAHGPLLASPVPHAFCPRVSVICLSSFDACAWLPRGWLRPFASPERHGRRDHETVSVCVLWPSEIPRNLSGSAASIGIGSAALDGRTSVHPTRALISSKRRMMWLGTTGDQTKARKFPAPWRDGIGRDWVMSCVNFDLKRTTASASPRTRRAVDRLFAIAPRRKTRVVTSTVTRHGQGVPSRSRAHRGWQTGRPPSRRLLHDAPALRPP